MPNWEDYNKTLKELTKNISFRKDGNTEEEQEKFNEILSLEAKEWYEQVKKSVLEEIEPEIKAMINEAEHKVILDFKNKLRKRLQYFIDNGLLVQSRELLNELEIGEFD